jgi:hypothetical protein
VDFERGILFLPDSKTGQKPVYLSAAALDVLARLPRVDGNPHIIAGLSDGAPRADLKRPWEALTRAAGLSLMSLVFDWRRCLEVPLVLQMRLA